MPLCRCNLLRPNWQDPNNRSARPSLIIKPPTSGPAGNSGARVPGGAPAATGVGNAGAQAILTAKGVQAVEQTVLQSPPAALAAATRTTPSSMVETKLQKDKKGLRTARTKNYKQGDPSPRSQTSKPLPCPWRLKLLHELCKRSPAKKSAGGGMSRQNKIDPGIAMVAQTSFRACCCCCVACCFCPINMVIMLSTTFWSSLVVRACCVFTAVGTRVGLRSGVCSLFRLLFWL